MWPSYVLIIEGGSDVEDLQPEHVMDSQDWPSD